MAETPLMKQLVSSDRKARDSALSSLRAYLSTPNRSFTPGELLKLHKALFFTMWHADRPIPQQKLATSLADLALSLPDGLFIHFVAAFWQTMAREWTNIDALRMDKFLRLVRCYVGAGFEWCRRHGWRGQEDGGLVREYMQLVREWPLSLPAENRKVGDGLRYHVLDVWVDEMEKAAGVDGRSTMPLRLLMEPVRRLLEEGDTKALRTRAKECLEDERLVEWMEESKVNEGSSIGTHAGKADDDEEFEGLDGD